MSSNAASRKRWTFFSARARAALRLRDSARWRQPRSFSSCPRSTFAMAAPAQNRDLDSPWTRIRLPERIAAASVTPEAGFEGGAMRIGLMLGPERGRYRHKAAQLAADAAAAERD